MFKMIKFRKSTAVYTYILIGDLHRGLCELQFYHALTAVAALLLDFSLSFRVVSRW